MKRIFLDTNFIIDYFIREGAEGDCERLLSLGHTRNDSFFISYLTIANFAYIMRKMPKTNLYTIIERICNTFKIVKNTKEQIQKNLELKSDDFEDGLQYQAAIESRCDVIITRNKKDFSFSIIPVMSASEYLKTQFL